MKGYTSGVLELRPERCTHRAAPVSRRSAATIAAATAAPGAGRGKPSKAPNFHDPGDDDLAGEPLLKPRTPRHADGGYPGQPTKASGSALRRNNHADDISRATRPGPPHGPDNSSSSSTRGSRSEQERQARRAARISDKAAAASRNSQGCCYGCGAPLQTDVPLGAGYVAPDKYAMKKQRRQLDRVLCQRCSELCNGAMIPAVQDFTQKLQLKQLMGSGGASPGVAAAPDLASDARGAGPGFSGADSGGALVAGAQAAGRSVSQEAAGQEEEAAASLLDKVLVTPEQLRAQLTPLALRAAVIVLLVDLTDASGTLMSRVRDMVGRNPIVLVGTKMDLLPEGCRLRDVAEWLTGAAAAKKLNVVSVHLVSSHTGDGMSAAVARICRERKSRDVYVVGAANVGKSAFVRAMLKEMARTDPAAIGTGRYLPVESAMPGTTLGLIPLRAFSSGGILYDTPGVHLHHRIPHMLSPTELRLLHPRRRLAAFVPPLPAELMDGDGDNDDDADPRVGSDTATNLRMGPDGSGSVVRQGRGGLKIVDYQPMDEYGMPITGLDAGVRRGGGGGKAEGGGLSGLRGAAADTPRDPSQPVRATYMWSDLVRVDVLTGPPSTALVFYGPSTMRAVALPYIPADKNLEVDYGGEASSGARVLVCTESVAARGGLQPHELVIRANGAAGNSALADVAVSGLPGWVSVWAPDAKQGVRLRVWAPRGVEVIQRTPLPCPPPRALSRAWRGERGGGAEEKEEGEEPAALDEWSRALAASVGDPTSDPAWWEAMAALKDEDLPGYSVAVAAGKSSRSGRRGGSSNAADTRSQEGPASGRRAVAGDRDSDDEDDDEADDDLPDWDDEAELLEEDGDAQGADDGDAERVMVMGRVEDILKRPRLDVLSQMDLELADDGEGEEDQQEDDDVASFTLTRDSGGRRRRDGPAADGSWDPLAGPGVAVTSAAAGASTGSATARSRLRAAGPSGASARRATASSSVPAAAVATAATDGVGVRRGRAGVAGPPAGRSTDLVAAAGEQEEDVPEPDTVWDEAGVESDEAALETPGSGSARRRAAAKGSRRRLGRRREVVRVAVTKVDGERVQGEVD